MKKSAHPSVVLRHTLEPLHLGGILWGEVGPGSEACSLIHDKHLALCARARGMHAA